jgi:S-adenosylmethionine decarboxylase
MDQLGTQLIIELYGCDTLILNNKKTVTYFLLGAAEKLGATILSSYFHKFSPQGITGIVAIAESHLSIHTWPEHAYAAVDIFTCGNRTHPHEAAKYLIERFSPDKHHIQEITRGVH